MAKITQAQLNAAFRVVSGAFYGSYTQLAEMEMGWDRAMTMSETTDQDTITLNWIEARMGLRFGKRGQGPLTRRLLGTTTTLTVLKQEDGVDMDHHIIAQDRLGQYIGAAHSIGEAAAWIPRRAIADVCVNGDTSAYLIFDGQNYFDNAHPASSGSTATTFDNLSAGALTATTYAAERARMRTFPSDSGTAYPLGLIGNVLMVSAANEVNAKQIMNSSITTTLTGNYDNILKGMSEVVVVDELTDANDWFLWCSSRIVKPFIHVFKAGFSPLTIQEYGRTPESELYAAEKAQIKGWTYELVYPTRPEFGIKVVV